jgi:integrase
MVVAEPDGVRAAVFYGVSLGQTTVLDRIPFAREPRKLPTVLSADEVVRFLEAVSSLKARVALTTAYAAGLRVSEVAALKVSDIDSSRMVLRIERGKGGKERYALRDAARHSARVLAAGAAEAVPVSRSAGRQAHRTERAACRLPIGDGCGGARQACERACVAA